MRDSNLEKNILLVNPPNGTAIFQDYNFLFSILKTKAVAPPLPLLTVAGMIPEDFNIRLVDMNAAELDDEDLEWASLVFITGIEIHREEIKKLTRKCRAFDVITVAGGLCVTRRVDDIENVDCFVLGEAEELLPELFSDIQKGTLKAVYNSGKKPDLKKSPCPRYDLLDMTAYNCAVLQWSRGCPFFCEFCHITVVYGRKVRVKPILQFLREMDALYAGGFKGSLMLGDDNFLTGKEVKTLLEAIKDWQKAHGFPFSIFVQTDISIASKDEMMHLMFEAGFCAVQIGLESPSRKALLSVNKKINTKYDLVEAVHKIHKNGLEVYGAIMVGLDGEPENICKLQYEFIHKAGIPQVMISLLDVISGTRLHERLESEGRLLNDFKGKNTGSYALNFIPLREPEKLISDYLKLVAETYLPSAYFKRCRKIIQDLKINPETYKTTRKEGMKIMGRFVLKTCYSKYFWHFLIFLLKTLTTFPKKTAKAVDLGITGYQFYKITKEEVRTHSHIKLSRAEWSRLYAE